MDYRVAMLLDGHVNDCWRIVRMRPQCPNAVMWHVTIVHLTLSGAKTAGADQWEWGGIEVGSQGKAWKKAREEPPPPRANFIVSTVVASAPLSRRILALKHLTSA